MEQLLPVTYDQLAEKVRASVEKDRVTEPKDALEAPVAQSSAVGDPVTVAGTVGVESGLQMRPEGEDAEDAAANMHSRMVSPSNQQSRSSAEVNSPLSISRGRRRAVPEKK